MVQSQPELYLILPPAIEPDSFARQPAQALEAPAVAALLLWLADDDLSVWQRVSEALVAMAHSRGSPLLIADTPERAARCGGDGLHMEADAKQIAAAQRSLGGKRMLGAGNIADRHSAMLAGEAGADYVFFGSANPHQAKPLPSLQLLSLVEWWSEMFQIPCVAPATEFEQAARLAAAGADFVAVRDLVWNDPRGPAAALNDLAQAMGGEERLA